MGSLHAQAVGALIWQLTLHLGFRDIPMMGKQMDKKMENEMDPVGSLEYIGLSLLIAR